MVLIAAPAGRDAPDTVVDSATQQAEKPDIGGTPESPMAASASSFSGHSWAGWVAAAVVGIGTMIVALAVGWFYGQRSNRTLAVPAAHSHLTSESNSFVPEPVLVEDVEPQPDNVVPEGPSEEENEIVEPELVAVEVDPFETPEARAASMELAKSDDTNSSSIEPLQTAANDDRLSELVHLLEGNVGEAPGPDSETRSTTETTYRLSKPLVPTNIELLSKRPIRQVNFQRVPLVEFLRSMGQIANLPICLDADTLDISGHVATVPISVSKRNASVMDILQQAVAPLNLHPYLSERTINVTGRRDNRTVDGRFYVGDLFADNFDCAHFVATLVEPQSWTRAGGEGMIQTHREFLHTRNSKQVNTQVDVFLERLRIARSLPPAKTLPSHRTSITPRWKQLSNKLRRPIDVHLWGDSTVAQVVAEVERAADLRILMDWESLTELGIGPQSPAKLYLRNQTVESAMSTLAGNLGVAPNALSLCPVSADTVQLTSAQAAANCTFVDFYDFERLDTPNQMVIQQLMLGGNAAIDPVSGIAIVGATSKIHRTLSR